MVALGVEATVLPRAPQLIVSDVGLGGGGADVRIERGGDGAVPGLESIPAGHEHAVSDILMQEPGHAVADRVDVDDGIAVAIDDRSGKAPGVGPDLARLQLALEVVR